MIKSMKILGFRGFGREQTCTFSLPNNDTGSGLTVIVGANNSGKSTIIEAIRSFNGNQTPSYSVGKRNTESGSSVTITATTADDEELVIKTVPEGGSSTNRNPDRSMHAFVLPSRRFVPFEFGKNAYSRDDYLDISTFTQREYGLINFYLRLFTIQNNKRTFDDLLHKILPDDFEWTIDQADSGQYFVKYNYNGKTHNSEGVGDGIWSIFTICDALYDSSPGSIIVIDEPELSLHPAYQKRLLNVLLEYSKDRQVILCTHSPYFVSWESLMNGGHLIRTVKDSDGDICVYNLDKTFKEKINGLLADINNPHVLGLSAAEVFFLPDKVILVEGQEDVVIFNNATQDKRFDGEFFGWGVGGASKMETFLFLLKSLGYKRVVAIFDGDKKTEKETAEVKYPDYHFILLPTDDIRDKKFNGDIVKVGMTTQNGKLKDDYKQQYSDMVDAANGYLNQ